MERMGAFREWLRVGSSHLAVLTETDNGRNITVEGRKTDTDWTGTGILTR